MINQYYTWFIYFFLFYSVYFIVYTTHIFPWIRGFAFVLFSFLVGNWFLASHVEWMSGFINEMNTEKNKHKHCNCNTISSSSVLGFNMTITLSQVQYVVSRFKTKEKQAGTNCVIHTYSHVCTHTLTIFTKASAYNSLVTLDKAPSPFGI